METVRDILIYFAGSVALAILCWQGHLWWLERQERREQEAIARLEERAAVEEAEAILKEIQR